MFFGDINKKIDRLIKKEQWDTIRVNIEKTTRETRMKIVEGSKSVAFEEVANQLIYILGQEAESKEMDQTLFAAVLQVFADRGNDRVISNLRYFQDRMSADKSAQSALIDETVAKIRSRKS